MGITINGSSAAGNIDLGTNGTITDLAVGGLPDGVVDTDSLANNAVTTAKSSITEYDDTNLRRDLSTLALQTAVDTNRKAYNLQNSFIDQFEDDTGLATQTNVDRNTSEYVSSLTATTVPASRYWRLYKTSSAVGGGYHKEFQLFSGSSGSYSQVTINWNADWTHNDLDNWVASEMTDGDTVNNAFHTDSAGVGAWVKIDLGSGNEASVTKWRAYISTPKSCLWDIQCSNDNSNWTTVKTGWQTDDGQANGANGWVVDAEWTMTQGANSATGTLISTANTASSSRTKVSGTVLYKNNAGTATLGTDFKVYFTCNGGTNWTEAASYTAGSDFSTGIKTVYLGETTCTAGTDVRYKTEWANQASGSKDTQLHGIGVNY